MPFKIYKNQGIYSDMPIFVATHSFINSTGYQEFGFNNTKWENF
jgi:hypothetical protein